MDEPTIIYCVDGQGNIVTRGMYRHTDGWWSHPHKKVNRLEPWRFWSTNELRAEYAAALIKQANAACHAVQVQLDKLLEDNLDS